jgi:hypothetical protein
VIFVPTRDKNNLKHIYIYIYIYIYITITKLKYATMTSLDTRQVKLHWLLQIYSSEQLYGRNR